MTTLADILGHGAEEACGCDRAFELLAVVVDPGRPRAARLVPALVHLRACRACREDAVGLRALLEAGR